MGKLLRMPLWRADGVIFREFTHEIRFAGEVEQETNGVTI
jgi:hypothetical protein